MTANAASTPLKTDNSNKVTIYDGDGVFVGEFDSVEEFQTEYLGINPDQRGVAALLLKALSIMGKITTVSAVSYLFTGFDPLVWVRENVVVPFYNEAKNMELYSVSGGITNPYPPNSYQYSQFNKTNYYWVVQ